AVFRCISILADACNDNVERCWKLVRENGTMLTLWNSAWYSGIAVAVFPLDDISCGAFNFIPANLRRGCTQAVYGKLCWWCANAFRCRDDDCYSFGAAIVIGNCYAISTSTEPGFVFGCHSVIPDKSI